LGKSFTQVQRL